MRLVEGLASIEDRLRAQAQTPCRVDLEVRQRVRKRGAFALDLALGAKDMARGSPAALDDLRSDVSVEDPPSLVDLRGPALGRPARREHLARRRAHLGGHDGVRRRLKGLDGGVARCDEPEQRRLHAPNREHPLVVPGRLAEQAIEPRHVDAVEPVGSLARESGCAEWPVLRVRLDRRELAPDGVGIRVVDEQPVDGTRVAEEVEHLVDEELALAVGIARVHDAGCAAQKHLDPAEHRRDRRSELPVARHDRQVVQRPVGVLAVVLLGHDGLEDVADAPGDDVVAALEVVAVATLRQRQDVRDGARKARLFGDEETHGQGPRGQRKEKGSEDKEGGG